MKKSTMVTVVRVPKRLRSISHENQNRLLICKQRQACPKCGKITVTYLVKCPVFNLSLHLTPHHYSDLLENDFKDWVVETMFEEFDSNSMLLQKGELHFSKRDVNGASGSELKTVVSKLCGTEIIEVLLAKDRFKDLQDILDYKLVDFYSDINSGSESLRICA